MEKLDNKVLKKIKTKTKTQTQTTSKNQTTNKPKPKEETFHEILLKCFKNNTIAKETPPNFKKEIEKAMDLLKNINSRVFQNFYLINIIGKNATIGRFFFKIMKILKR